MFRSVAVFMQITHTLLNDAPFAHVNEQLKKTSNTFGLKVKKKNNDGLFFLTQDILRIQKLTEAF